MLSPASPQFCEVTAIQATGLNEENKVSFFALAVDFLIVFVIVSGSASGQDYCYFKAGQKNLAGIEQEGQFFGAACLHDVPARIASATAVGDCRISSVTKDVMLSTIQWSAQICKDVH